jgi:hypothetical protein
MKIVLLFNIVLTCLMITSLLAVISAADPVLELLPEELKVPGEEAIYEDEAFFKETDPVIKSLSNRAVPTESHRAKVYSAYYRARGMSISPQNYDTANGILAFLYYTAKTGEAYETFFKEKNSIVALTDGSEYYYLASIYYEVASTWWALIADRYPKVTLYTLPAQDDPFPVTDTGIGTFVEGLKYPLIFVQKDPDLNKTFQDEEVKTTVSRWIEDNLEVIPLQTDWRNESQGHNFILSDGPRWAKSIYISLSMKNVRPEFYETANYINAFLYYLSQAREFYDQYITDRTSYVSISDGTESYAKAKAYYNEAGVALSLFKGQIPDMNQTITLPAFPNLEEVPIGSTTVVAYEGLAGSGVPQSSSTGVW